MTSVRQLYVLQELDLVLDRLRSQQTEAEPALKAEDSGENLENALSGEAERLQEVASQQRDNQMESEARRERSQTLETPRIGPKYSEFFGAARNSPIHFVCHIQHGQAESCRPETAQSSVSSSSHRTSVNIIPIVHTYTY